MGVQMRRIAYLARAFAPIGVPGRRSRLHDEEDVFAGWSALRGLPPSLVEAVRRRVLHHPTALPWWPWPAIGAVEAILGPTSDVLEFGSGFSTLWLGARARSVVSIEDEPAWQARVAGMIDRAGRANATCLLRQGSHYYDLSFLEGRRLDLVIVDGSHRFESIAAAIDLLNEGGWIYLDNSDADKDWSTQASGLGSRRARGLLEELARARGCRPTVLRGFAPDSFFVQAGLLVGPLPREG